MKITIISLIIAASIIIPGCCLCPCDYAPAEKQETVRILVENTNGSTTAVDLLKVGSHYYGPKGERYDSLPSRKLLSSIYSW